jgi:DNA-directed RNA polymerase II subunit RPB2
MWDEAISTFFKDGVSRFSEGQVEPFEDFLYNKIPLVLRSTPAIVVWHEQDEATKKYKYEFRLSFDNVSYMKPRIQEATGRLKQMLPYEARVRNFTYAAQMFVDVKFCVRCYSGPLLTEITEQSKVFEGISMGKIPVMLGSSLCVLKDFHVPIAELGECSGDPFGYFIIHGSERIILSQEKVADNRNMVFMNKKTSSKYTHSVEMKSLHESFTMPPKKVEIRISSKFNGLGYPLSVCIPRFREDIPLMVFFRALGVVSDKDVYDRIGEGSDEYMAPSFKEAADMNIFAQEEAIEYLTHHLQYPSLSEDKHAHIRALLQSEFLPHVNLAQETLTPQVAIARKVLILVSMIKKLISTARGQTRLDDRDAYPNKRVVTTGALLTHLFRQLFQKVCKDIRSKLVHEINNDNWKRAHKPLDALSISNLYKILKVSSIEGKMKQALATGNFTVQGLGTSNSTALSNATKSGVSQVLNRMSYCATLSHVRRIQTPVEKSGKLLAPRKLHGTSWGFVCPVETPEGHNVGIVKTMSLMTTVSGHVPSFVVTDILRKLPSVVWVSSIASTGEVAILVNGVIIGHTSNPTEVHKTLRDAKSTCQIHPHISIAWNVLNKTILVETDAGRLVRPVFRVKNGKLLSPPADRTNWNAWVSSCVEYIDPSESDVVHIAMMPEDITVAHTHCEIHPQMILGHMAATIPLSDHNQSPRNTYQSAMGKQAMSIYASNYQKRLDKNAYIICSPQRPLVETRITRILGMPKMPFGENAIVAIACYSGYNQEDSVILNRNSLKRGFMRGLYYSMYKDEEHRNVASGREERFARPRQETTRGFKNTSYHAVQENGIPAKNTIIQENDVVIGKVVNLRNDPHGFQFKDLSTTHKSAEPCRVDGVWQDKNADGYPFVKVRVVSERFPTIGDKFSSRHGQKGTVGMILDECDMPFTSSGLRPDIIMNPHAVPSRMTIAQLLETMYSRIGVRKGTVGDGTPYSHLKMEELSRQMEELGLHPYGNEIMYNGMTGEMMEVEIFIGTTFYQRLKHMVIDKSHCLTSDHDVLTTTGWKPINEVTLKDEVATLQNGNVVYEHPINTLEFDYEGDMYELTSQQVSLKTTPNHRMWVGTCHTRKQEWRYGFHEAKDIIGKHVKYQKDGHWEKDEYSFILPAFKDYIARKLDMESWLIFLGIWFGDGWCNHGKKNQVEIAANKPRVKDALDVCLPALGFAYTYYPSDKKLHVKSKQLAAYMSQFSVGAINKSLPDWVWELNQPQCRQLLAGLKLSDGHSTACGKMIYSTASNKLADDVQRLALHAGWSANKILHTRAGTPYSICGRSGITTADLWSLRIVTSKNRPAVNHGHHKEQHAQKEEMVPFNGKVFCLEVPGNIFYVRRNGRPVWTGNSRARGPIVSLTRQPCEGRARDGGLRVGEMERDCMLTHGASIFTKERLMDVSDPFETGICRTCGSLATMNEVDAIYECRACASKVGFEKKTIPYAVKLWLQELEAMHISPRMMFGKDE